MASEQNLTSFEMSDKCVESYTKGVSVQSEGVSNKSISGKVGTLLFNVLQQQDIVVQHVSLH